MNWGLKIGTVPGKSIRNSGWFGCGGGITGIIVLGKNDDE